MRILLLIPNLPSWRGEARAALFTRLLTHEGHEVTVLPLNKGGSPSPQHLKVDLVCNHAIQAPPEAIRQLATTHPNITFVNINHSAIAHLERENPTFINRFTSAIHSARQVQNIWYASQDRVGEDIVRAANIERSVWLPTPGHILSPRPYNPPGDKVNVVIGGRCDPIKNHLCQILACAMLRDKIHLTLCMDPSKAIHNLLHALNLPVTIKGHLPHTDWIKYLTNHADIVLCGSLAESYCFVAAEAMQLGIPTITSEAIQFGYDHLRYTLNHPNRIAEKILYAIEHHHLSSKACILLGSKAAKAQVEGYLTQINRWTPQ